MSEKMRKDILTGLSLALVMLWSFAPSAAAQEEAEESINEDYAGLEEITISARKREEKLQEVPISVTALSGEALDAQHISDTLQIQFDIPNFLFGKTNFTGQNLQIRGIGSAVVAASGEAAVGVHVNTVPLPTRLFEQEFYDVDRIEVLRGPQGTIFGRNSTGGSFNVWTKKPTDEYEGNLEIEGANYDSIKLKGAFNFPLSDDLRLRFAGVYHDREGFIYNEPTDTHIDDRNLFGVRGSLQYDIADDTTADLMISYFKESDMRARYNKQLCKKDTAPFPFNIGCTNEPPVFEAANSLGSLASVFEGPAMVTFGLPPLYPVGVDSMANSVNPADYRKTANAVNPSYNVDELQITLDLSHEKDDLTFSWVSGYTRSHVDSRQDYFMAIPSLAYDPVAVATLAGAFPAAFSSPGGSELCLDGTMCFDRSWTRDQSSTNYYVASSEFRVVSDFDSRLNFTAGAIGTYGSSQGDYFVYFGGAEILGRIWKNAADPTYDPALYHYDNATKPATTWSIGLFAEAYYDLTDSTKLTAGLRYTHDEKTARSRQSLLNGLGVPGAGVLPPWEDQEASWNAGTGRLSLDHDFDFDFTDQSMGYVSVSRGYKPGGFNPPQAADNLLLSVDETFKPETIWAYEAGTKNMLAGNRVQANVSAFFYDYQDYQISKIVSRTSVNENIDAFIWGLEAEFVYVPIENLRLSMGLAYLGSSIRDSSSIDPADPTAGDPAWFVVKDQGNGSNQITSDPGDPLNSAFWNTDGGIAKDLDGNELPNTPDVQINLMAQYTYPLADGSSLMANISYYWQNDMYGRIFNSPRDKISSWSQTNIVTRYQNESQTFHFDLWVRNVADAEDITGHYFTDASSANFTNVFLLEPRTFGATVGVTF